MSGWRRLLLLALLLLARAERTAPQDAVCPLQCDPGTEPRDGGCVACSAGRVSWGGTAQCVPCEAGMVPAQGQGGCVVCEPGSRPLVPLNATCERCPPGRYSNILTHGSCHVCGQGSVPTAAQSYCTRCVAGEQPNAGRTACEGCPAGYVSLTEQAECHACAAGRVTNSEQSECQLCPPGQETVAGRCQNCTAGKYSSHESACGMCPEGHVPSQAQDYCVRCVAGERPNADRTACERCPESYVSATAEADCHACPAGRIPNSEQSQCEPCPPGCEPTDGRQCSPCSAGNFSTLFGNCRACPAGHVPRVCDGGRPPTCIESANVAQETCEPAGSCDRCPAGTAPNAEQTVCEPCPYGHVARSGDYQCRSCPAGSVAAVDDCVLCAEGSAPNHMELAERCEACPAGRTASPGDTGCTACPEGYHSQTDGSNCVACLGRMETNLEQTGCVCKADHFNASLYPSMYPSASPGCVPCDSRTLGEISGRVTCPGGRWRPGGRSTLFADPGFWIGNWSIHEGASTIELASDDREETKDLFIQLGFTAATSQPTISDFVYYCSSPLVCPGFTLSGSQQRYPPNRAANLSAATGLNLTEMTALCEAKDGASTGQCIRGSVCAHTHSGVLCGTCSSPHGLRMQKLSDHRCAVCQGSSVWYIVALMVSWAIFALFLDFKARQINVDEDGAALGILTFFLQSLALFADKKGDNALYGLARLINMDLISAVETDEGTPQCLLDIGPVGGWLMSAVWVPVYLCLCSAVVLKLQETSYARKIAADIVRDAEHDLEGVGRNAKHDAEDGGKLWLCFEKVKAKYTAATNLNFLHLRVLYRADNAGLTDGSNVAEARALLTWWRLSCVILKKKMIRKHRFRMVLEVAMFTYMGATKQAFRLIPGVTACRHIDGQWYSSLDVQMSCADTYGVQAISMILLCCFTAGFPVYILWRVQKIDAGVDGSLDTTGRAGPKASRFTTMARVAHIFTSRHRGWMAYLMLRRVVLVAVFQIGSMHGGFLHVPGTRGGQVDWRVLPFFVVAIFVLLQAWERPFSSDLDNSLEQTTLTMLLCVLYANVALTQPTWKLGSSELAPNLVVLFVAMLFVLAVWLSQMQAREQMQRLAQADFGGIVEKLSVHYDAQSVAQQGGTQEGKLSANALASLQRTAVGPTDVGKAMDSVWTTGRSTVRAPKKLLQIGARDADLPAVVFDEKITAKSAVTRGLKGLSEEDLVQIDQLKQELDVTTLDVLKYFETFACFDKDGSGLLDVSELMQVFDMLGGSRTRNEDILRRYLVDIGLDEDASGDVSFPEFLKMMVLEKKKIDQDEELEEAYKTFVQSGYQADQRFGSLESDVAHQNAGYSEPPITQKILLHQLLAEGILDDDTATASEQEELVRVMVRVANRFAPAEEVRENISEADGTPESVAFAAGAALGVSHAADDGSESGAFENPMSDSVGHSGDQTPEQVVSYSTFRAMMIAIGDPSKVALDVALVNERSRLAKETDSASEESEAIPKRKRFVTVG